MTDSSVVVLTGSLQAANGINLTARRPWRDIDENPDGVADCAELLVDLPDYFRAVHGRDPTGFSDVVPAVKVQLGSLPGGGVFSATAGLGVPTGARGISGHGYNPYVQFPRSREIGGGWSLSGMFTPLWFAGQKSNAISEATFVAEREVGAYADLFVELITRKHGAPNRRSLSAYCHSAN